MIPALPHVAPLRAAVEPASRPALEFGHFRIAAWRASGLSPWACGPPKGMKALSTAAKQQRGPGKNAGRNAGIAAWKGGATGPVGSRFSTLPCRRPRRHTPAARENDGTGLPFARSRQPAAYANGDARHSKLKT